ncbi:MAG TPA: YihY/virulence factor BrkB family protein [Candidatus Saccharimonadia bacterium]
MKPLARLVRRHSTLIGVAATTVIVLVGAALGYTTWPARRPRTQVRNPAQLPARQWRQAVRETKAAISNKDLGMLAAGVAYFMTLAAFPMLAAAAALYAAFVTPAEMLAAAQRLGQYLPPELGTALTNQLTMLAAQPQHSLQAGLLALAVALFGASSGAQNLIRALNHSYDVLETRGFIRLRLISLIFIAGALVAALPLAILLLFNSGWLSLLRWPLFAVIITLALAIIYRYAPNRRKPRWQIVSWGGTAAAMIWLLGTGLFFVYLRYFANFSRTYGVFAGLIIFMTWLNISAFIVLIGAEVNNRLERQTDQAPQTIQANRSRNRRASSSA